MNIIILHGWMQNKNDWQVFVNQLSAIPHIKSVQAIDLPGFGNEETPPGNWGIPDYAQWVTKWIQKEKLTDVVLLGHSFGGRIGSYIASERPHWLKALILSGTPSLYRPTAKMKLKLNIFKRIKKFVPSKTKQHFYSEELNIAESKGLGPVFRSVVSFDQTELIGKINVPTLLVWGSNDDSVSLSIAKEMNALIPDSKLTIINSGTHNSFISHPYLFLGHVKKFIDSL